jgi:uncharacterized protein
VGVISALAGIGGGVVMVPFLYLGYSRSAASLTEQTVVAHATSLAVAWIASLVGIQRYARAHAIAWRPAIVYGISGALSAFIAAKVVARAEEAEWVRGAFGLFLIVSALDMARRAATHRDYVEPKEAHRHSPVLLVLIGLAGGVMTSTLGIGGGIIAVPALLYVARLPIRMVAPTSLAAVGFATLAGTISYLTAAGAPPVSTLMAGWVDFRMALPLAAGAILTVPIGVYLNRQSKPATLYWIFALLLAMVGVRLIWQGWFS